MTEEPKNPANPQQEPPKDHDLTDEDLTALNRIKELEEQLKKANSQIKVLKTLKPQKDESDKPKVDQVDEVLKEMQKRGWQ